MFKHSLPVRRLSCIFLGAIGWFCVLGCTQPSDVDTKNEMEIPAEFTAGLAVYDQNCGSCHDSSRDGAPRLGYEPAWTRRIAQGKDVLTQHAIEGMDLMPSRGGNEDLTDDEISQAVGYIIYRAEKGIPASH